MATRLAAGEAMRESAPSGPRTTLDRNGRPSDPLLDRLVNPSQIKPGRDDSSIINPLLAPRPNAANLDPSIQKQWKREIERQRNWLLENATRMASPDKPAGARDLERPTLGLRERTEKDAPAASRYLQARDAARDEEWRRSPLPGTSPGPSNPSAASLAHEAGWSPAGSDRHDDRPLDTSRITQLGSDPAGGISTLSPSSALGLRSVGPVSAGADVAGRAIEDVRKIASQERTSAFESLLESPGSSVPTGGTANATMISGAANAASLAVVGFEPQRAPASRSRQFESLLAGGSPVGSPLAGSPSRAQPTSEALPGRSTGLPDFGKPSAPSSSAPGPAPASRPAERRFQAQPAILELPRFNQ